ncbi:hypothetical protein KAR10_01695 [bacterium]|nr:hypothetical protein [bacterium]
MKTKFNLLVGILAVVLIVPNVVLAVSATKSEEGGCTKNEGSMIKHEGSDTKDMKACMTMCPMCIKGVAVKVKNIKNGVEIKITSKDKEIVKQIQEKAQKCLAMKDTKAKAEDKIPACR